MKMRRPWPRSSMGGSTFWAISNMENTFVSNVWRTRSMSISAIDPPVPTEALPK